MELNLKQAMDAAKVALKDKRAGICMTVGVDAAGRFTRAVEGMCVDELAFRKAAPATSRIFRATRTATGIEVSDLGFNAAGPSVHANLR
jgi:hypothetical protein